VLKELPHKLAVGLTLALAGAVLGATGVLAAPAPVDATSDRQTQIDVFPRSWIETWPEAVTQTTVRSPITGLNVRVPGLDSPSEQSPSPLPGLPELERNDTSIVHSPATGRNVRVPAF